LAAGTAATGGGALEGGAGAGDAAAVGGAAGGSGPGGNRHGGVLERREGQASAGRTGLRDLEPHFAGLMAGRGRREAVRPGKNIDRGRQGGGAETHVVERDEGARRFDLDEDAAGLLL
jgi:hypothetical protein